ncbi:MAG TPA: hypothetical protein VFQ85_03720 [Mycobacteriales bacterium]|nr:hypothetical protein [Mycobacteriales bacterium]
MTDLPRRSYPLVVPPPGGFEDAVRRGRRRRRKQTGGSSALALVLVAALGYGVVSHQGTGTDTVRPANDPPVVNDGGAPRTTNRTTPTPSVTPAAGHGTGTTTGSTGRTPTSGRSSGSASGSTLPPTGPVGALVPTRPPVRVGSSPRYASRVPVTRDPESATDANCLSAQTEDWCTYVSVTPPAGPGQKYMIDLTLCRSVGAGAKTIDLDRHPDVDFAAVDVAHNDTVWTYSAGQPVVHDGETVTIDPGYCVYWHTRWDGYDDFGYTPAAGTYRLSARILTSEPLPLATTDFTHD